MKPLVAVLGFFLVVAFGLSQTNSESGTDDNTRTGIAYSKMYGHSDSTGLFTSSDGLRQTYFRKGLKHGPFRSYYLKNGRIACFGHYTNDVMSGDWHYFDENDLLIMSEHSIRLNDTAMATNGDGRPIRPLMRSLLRRYWPNGLVRMEGTCLYNESAEIDFWRYGTWTYYDTLGLPQKTSEYYPGQFVND